MPATYSKRRVLVRCGSLIVIASLLVSSPANRSSAADDAKKDSENSVATVPIESPKTSPPVLAANDEAEVAAVVEIWKKLRGNDAPAVDPSELVKALHKLKAQETEQKNAISGAITVAPGFWPNPYTNNLAAEGSNQTATYAPVIAPATTEPIKKDKLTSLRETARKLDSMAEELDELELYEQADGLRQQAQTIRTQWRQIRTTENGAHIRAPFLPGPSGY
jgi:hypothetical protein